MIFPSLDQVSHLAMAFNIQFIIYKNKVVDVSLYKQFHPGNCLSLLLGGPEPIDMSIGKDVSDSFDAISSHQSNIAKVELESLVLGEIQETIRKKMTIKCSLDMNKGFIWQLYQYISVREYRDFIHNAKLRIIHCNIRLFDNPLIEFLFRTPWWTIISVYSPLVARDICCLIYSTNKFVSVVALLLGLSCWVILEGLIKICAQKVVNHLMESCKSMLIVHFYLIGLHQAFPMDRYSPN